MVECYLSLWGKRQGPRWKNLIHQWRSLSCAARFLRVPTVSAATDVFFGESPDLLLREKVCLTPSCVVLQISGCQDFGQHSQTFVPVPE